jgi:hypothetical protein
MKFGLLYQPQMIGDDECGAVGGISQSIYLFQEFIFDDTTSGYRRSQ